MPQIVLENFRHWAKSYLDTQQLAPVIRVASTIAQKEISHSRKLLLRY